MSERPPADGVPVERPRSQSLPRSNGNYASITSKLQQSGHTFSAAAKPTKRCKTDGDVTELYLPETGILRAAGTDAEKYTKTAVPEEQRRFVAYQVETIIKEVLEAKLYKVRYEPNTCSRLAQELCASIKDKAKALDLHRYKLVTHVLLGEDTDKSVQVAARCLWNQDMDNFAAATFRNNWIYAVAIVYGMYLE